MYRKINQIWPKFSRSTSLSTPSSKTIDESLRKSILPWPQDIVPSGNLYGLHNNFDGLITYFLRKLPIVSYKYKKTIMENYSQPHLKISESPHHYMMQICYLEVVVL